ncbi:MAG: phosphatase PAP2 family protein [Candidatus Gastranaerophilales bacterium]|nr:phosphatase PAP2 family protein [Candidatus Gastranaerophilales bacterium]
MKKAAYNITRNWQYIGILSLIFVLITLFVFFVPNSNSYDFAILKAIQALLVQYPVSLAHEVSHFGGQWYLFWPQLTVVSALFSHKKYSEGIFLVIFTQIAWRGGDLLKDIFGRERPCGNEYPGASYPSCHILTTMCFYGIIIYLVLTYVQNKFWRYFLIAFCSIFIFLVALSRWKLNVHFPTDVFAGMVLGLILLNLYIIITKAINKNLK